MIRPNQSLYIPQQASEPQPAAEVENAADAWRAQLEEKGPWFEDIASTPTESVRQAQIRYEDEAAAYEEATGRRWENSPQMAQRRVQLAEQVTQLLHDHPSANPHVLSTMVENTSKARRTIADSLAAAQAKGDTLEFAELPTDVLFTAKRAVDRYGSKVLQESGQTLVPQQLDIAEGQLRAVIDLKSASHPSFKRLTQMTISEVDADEKRYVQAQRERVARGEATSASESAIVSATELWSVLQDDKSNLPYSDFIDSTTHAFVTESLAKMQKTSPDITERNAASYAQEIIAEHLSKQGATVMVSPELLHTDLTTLLDKLHVDWELVGSSAA